VDAVIVCAGETSIAECESRKEKTKLINVTNTYKVLTETSLKRSHIVLISTDKVFGECNKDLDPLKCDPDVEYGRQKLELECLVSNLNTTILRLGKVVYHNLSILKKWRESLKNNGEIHAFYDYSLSPVDLDSVVIKINSIITSGDTGVFNFFGDEVSYYEFAVQYAKSLGYQKEVVKKQSYSELLTHD